jgi:hypothetical protein
MNKKTYSHFLGRAVGVCAVVVGAFLAAFVAVNVASANPSGQPPAGSGAVSVSGNNVGIEAASVDANYTVTLGGGGIKADVGSTANPAGYFSNAGTGAAISVGSGKIVAGAAGITLGGVNMTAWPTSNAGTVTSVGSGAGLAGGPITGSGTLTLDLTHVNTWTGAQTFNSGATASALTVNGASTFNSDVNMGSHKLTVGTIDPVYSINGANYATYGAGMTGVNEETAGTLTLVPAGYGADGTYAKTIDFGTQATGSDLWLFAHATALTDASNLSSLVVILTPSFDGRVWYKKNAATGTLTIYGDQAGEVSYRFTAPRFDANKWSNTAPAGEAASFTVK